MARKRTATVVIGDIVRSRHLPDRLSSQAQLKELMRSLNRKFAKARLTRFVITLGDEFEGVLDDGTAIADIIWHIETSFLDAPIRLAFGFGSISTDISPSPLEMDGQAFHLARAAITRAMKQDLLGGVFLGYGVEKDQILNGFSRLLHHHWSRLTPRQREILAQRREGFAQVEIASRSRVTESAISQVTRKSGWQAFSEAESGFRAALTIPRRKEMGK
jgi:hypothetical protein